MKRLALALLTLTLACKHDPPAPAPAPTSASSQASSLQEITVDRALLEDKRITLQTMETRGPAGASTIPGTVDPAESGAAQVTSLVAGRVASLAAKVGDVVTKGQVVATIESPDAGRAQAELLRARGRALLSSRALARQTELEAQEATSKAAVDQARAEDSAAKADLAAARAVLGSIGAPDPGEGGTASSAIALRAPITGVVVERKATLGGPIAANTELYRIVATDRVVVVGRLPETSLLRPVVGDAVTVAPRRGDGVAVAPCPGVVERVVPYVDETRTRTVRIVPSADAGCALVPGAFVEIRLRDAPEGANDAGSPVLWLPTSALIDVHGVTSVFATSTKEGSFVLRPVRVGITSGDESEILSGVAAGDRVVTSGALLLKGELLRQELQ